MEEEVELMELQGKKLRKYVQGTTDAQEELHNEAVVRPEVRGESERVQRSRG